jgi:hypothetical protein
MSHGNSLPTGDRIEPPEHPPANEPPPRFGSDPGFSFAEAARRVCLHRDRPVREVLDEYRKELADSRQRRASRRRSPRARAADPTIAGKIGA